MIQYPSILTLSKSHLPLGTTVHAFYKYDGSNLRFEYSHKKGWTKFGTRKHLFDKSDPLFSQAIPLFKDIEESITEKIKSEFGRVEKITAFAEFFGASSFAGKHDEKEEKELILFDIHVYKTGLIPVKTFLKLFDKEAYAAKVVYHGPLNKEFINSVRQNELNLKEGVVCKTNNLQSCKIKTIEFLTKLRELHHPAMFEEDNDFEFN